MNNKIDNYRNLNIKIKESTYIRLRLIYLYSQTSMSELAEQAIINFLNEKEKEGN